MTRRGQATLPDPELTSVEAAYPKLSASQDQ